MELPILSNFCSFFVLLTTQLAHRLFLELELAHHPHIYTQKKLKITGISFANFVSISLAALDSTAENTKSNSATLISSIFFYSHSFDVFRDFSTHFPFDNFTVWISNCINIVFFLQIFLKLQFV